jgi:chaperonin GroEL (HSP60 family)
MLQSIAVLTGGKAITEGLDIQLKSIKISDLGQAAKITIGKNNTVVEVRAGVRPANQNALIRQSFPSAGDPQQLDHGRAPRTCATRAMKVRRSSGI